MEKLHLRLEELVVESFATAAADEQRGTVLGHSDYPWMCSYPVSCDYGCNTRDDGTCPTGLTCQECQSNQSCQTCQTCQTCDGQVGCGPTWYMATCPPECYD